MTRIIFMPLILAVLLIVGCSSKAVYVEYDQTDVNPKDWYKIPVDAPAIVEIQKLTVPKITPYIEEESVSTLDSGLRITQLVDSLGNPSLKINRQTGNSWEIVDSALTGLEWNVSDRDRRNYKFELDPENINRGFFSRLFGNKDSILNLVLIPQGNETLVVVEGEEDELPAASLSRDVLDSLFEYLDNA